MKTTIEVRFRTTSAEEDTAEFASLEEALAACREGETVTVVAYHPEQGSPFWAAVETFRRDAEWAWQRVRETV